MDHAELRQHFYRELSPVYLQGELQSLYHWCVREIMGWGRAEVYLHNAEPVPDAVLQRWSEVIARLGRHEPVQYVFGRAYFRDMVLYVDSNVLIPRPETEELVQLVLDTQAGKTGLCVLDIGTGSGCIPLALKRARPGWQLNGCDVSTGALDVAKRNAQNNNLDVDFFFLDLTEKNTQMPLRPEVIVSNPPYIPRSQKSMLDRNVLDYEPHLALFAPASDPFYFFKRIVEEAAQWETKKVFFETHATDTAMLVVALASHWPGTIAVHRDMQGRERFLELTAASQ